MLKMFELIMLFIVMLGCFCRVVIIEVVSFGMLVLVVMMVRLIIVLLMLNFFVRIIEWFISRCDLRIRMFRFFSIKVVLRI